MQGQYNLRSPAVKRLMREAQELSEPTEQYYAHPLDDNLFEWHFTLRGPADSEFDGGLYHGRIILPAEYPMKPPSIILLTPNGRFETHKKICLSISGYHPESWQPSWSIRTALLAIIGFMPTHGSGAIGSLDYSAEERKVLARRSKDFKCPACGQIKNILKPVTEASNKTNEEAKELAKQISFQPEKEKKGSSSGEANRENTASTGASSQASAAQPAAAQYSFPPRFPMFPPMGFPAFPPGMFRAPTTNANSATSMSTMMPPFWPGIPTTQQSRMPLPSFFPPGFMMPANFAQQSQTQLSPTEPKTTSSSTPQSQDTATRDSTLSSHTTSDSSATPKETTSSTRSSASASADGSGTQTEACVQSDTAAVSQTAGANQPEVEAKTHSSSAQETGGAGVSQPSEIPQVRRRVAQTPAAPRPRAAPRQRVAPASRGSANPCAVGLMIVIAFALVLLIIRRLIMMKLLHFDLDFS